ncbi:LysR substrate-binding domain-containing protein [Paracidovorax konjaci]|nr:LysR substrate-binding domain-containing protein [Paracidovorax konjaci]
MSLLCLEASARLGSFTAAAQELHLTQGAVSRQIQALEDRLGVRLFVRRRESLVPTDAGRYYLGEVEPLLQRLERATVQVMAFQGRGGTLALSAGASVGAYWLIPRLPEFTRAHGEITLNLSTRVGPADFRSGAIDASLEFGDGRRPGLQSDFVAALDLAPYAAPSWVERFGACIAATTPRTALLHHHTLPDAWELWFRSDGLDAEAGRDGPRFEIMSMALNAAVAGLGAVLLPDFMAGDMLQAGRLQRLSPRTCRHAKGYYLVYPEASARLPALGTFRRWLLAGATPAQAD